MGRVHDELAAKFKPDPQRAADPIEAYAAYSLNMLYQDISPPTPVR